MSAETAPPALFPSAQLAALKANPRDFLIDWLDRITMVVVVLILGASILVAFATVASGVFQTDYGYYRRSAFDVILPLILAGFELIAGFAAAVVFGGLTFSLIGIYRNSRLIASALPSSGPRADPS